MSFLTITKAPLGGDIPDEIAAKMVGLWINCCTSERRYGLGFKMEPHVEDRIECFAISPYKVIEAALYGEVTSPEVVDWFRKEFPHAERGHDNSILFIKAEHCEYDP